jgi:hypothetical protein
MVFSKAPCGLNRYSLLVLVIVAVLGLINLPMPFHGDQAFFTVGVREMMKGAVLYRDYWDIKQPGIFYFYYLAALLFGTSEVGIHLFELLYLLALSVLLLLTLRPWFHSSLALALVPLLTVGAYYCVTSRWHLTQVEGLVAFPLYLCIYFSTKAAQTTHRRNLFWGLSGVMGAIAFLFKSLFLLILLPIWASALLYLVLHQRERWVRSVLVAIATIIAGVALPIGLTVVYFAIQDALPILYETFFVYPPRILEEVAKTNFEQLTKGLIWFGSRFALLILLAIPAMYFTLIKPAQSLLFLGLIFWSVVGLAVILIQRQSWWQYHYLLLVPPLGILAAKTIDLYIYDFCQHKGLFQSRRNRRVLVSGLIFLSLPIVASIALKGSILTKHYFALSSDYRLQFQDAISQSQYSTILKDTAFLSQPDQSPGDIYVLGDPLYYYLSGRNQATVLGGWSAEFLLPEQWQQIIAELDQTAPPYIFIGSKHLQITQERSPATLNFINQRYTVLKSSDAGTWYQRNQTPQ